jgi:hypothetical protein
MHLSATLAPLAASELLAKQAARIATQACLIAQKISHALAVGHVDTDIALATLRCWPFFVKGSPLRA